MRNDDALSSYDSDEWVMIDLRASEAMRRAGRTQAADALVGWVTAQAIANQNLIPELYNQTSNAIPINAYSGAIPMVGFGAAAYVLALLDRAGVSPENVDCDFAFPDGGVSPDGGNSDGGSSDGSVSADGGVPGRDGGSGHDAGAPPDLAMHQARMDGGCGCAVGARAPIGGVWMFLLLIALSRRIRCASRGRGRAAG
jgi:hypothetical protein